MKKVSRSIIQRISSCKVTLSPFSRPSALRTLALMGTRYRPFLGNREVVYSVSPIRTRTGITPQPYVTILEMALIARLCFAGTVTKNHGAGPRQKMILPLNSMCMSGVYQNHPEKKKSLCLLPSLGLSSSCFSLHPWHCCSWVAFLPIKQLV